MFTPLVYTLSIVAVNRANEVMTRIPIAIEALDTSPPVLELRSDDPDLNQGRLRAVRTGPFRIRVRALCGLDPAYTFVTGTVTQ